MQKIFKNASGAYYLKQLFFETADTEREYALYTLKSEDHTYDGVTYPSLRRLYLEMADETEFYFAEKYFGGWPHWKRLLSCSWFIDYLSDIREELAARNAADALNQIRSIARDKANKGSLQANRFLLEQSWKPKDSPGRPSKAKIKQEADRLFKSSVEIDDDLQRISAELDKASFR